MKISELSPELRPIAGDHQPIQQLLKDLESAVNSIESLSADDGSSTEPIAAGIRRSLSRFTSSAGTITLNLPESTKIHLWKLSYRLWNACVDLSNAVELGADAQQRRRLKTDQAELRHVAADILLVAGNPAGIPSAAFKAAAFFHKTGLIWGELGRTDRAAACFERAADLTQAALPMGDGATGAGIGVEERRLMLEINLSRARTAWEADDRNVAVALLNRSRNLILESPAGFRVLAEQYLDLGKLELSKSSDSGRATVAASKLLSEALDLCEKGLASAKARGVTDDKEISDLEAMKGRCLRFLAAERLKVEDFEGVLKCVKVLRASASSIGTEEHPSVGYVAMRAWLGAGRVAEAEKELKGMMVNKGVPEGACVSAAEAYLAVAGADAAKMVLLWLVNRCRVGAVAALRIVRRVAEGGGSGRVRVVAELVADEKVVALFQGTEVAKERTAMHALIWNCGAEHFRAKDYGISAQLFEKSMLYVPRNDDNRVRRSNCFRVLCLCFLALNQLDRAQEFIDEANKLDPNIKCAFLKFKIFLQRKEESEAITLVQTMVSYADFNPEYLMLSSHEAIACQSLPVAIASLSILLSLYSPSKQMPMTEVAALRNLITLLQRNSDNEKEVLKYTRRTRARMLELGSEAFFGTGAVGIREVNWFAGNSWNMGLISGKEKKYEACAEFFELAAEFYSLMSNENDENQNAACKSLIITVTAMLNTEEQKKVPLSDCDIKRAAEMLNKASEAFSTVSSSVQVSGSRQIDHSYLFFLHTYCSYQLIDRQQDDGRLQQLQLIKKFASSKTCMPSHLLQLGFLASQGQRPNPEAAEFAFSACLSNLLTSSSINYVLVSVALRKLICLAGSRETENIKNDTVYGVYRQAYQIVLGLKEGEYPVEEGKWLAMTAWNRSGMAVRLRQVSIARRWMKLGLDLAKHLKGMDKYISGMEDCAVNFEKLCGDAGRDEEGLDVGTNSQPILV